MNAHSRFQPSPAIRKANMDGLDAAAIALGKGDRKTGITMIAKTFNLPEATVSL